MDVLTREFATTHDMNVKAGIGRLSNELTKLDQPWVFKPERRSLVSFLRHLFKL
jgi:hypothetical protein